MASVEPQSVLTPLTEAAIFLVATVADGGEDAVADVLADVGAVTRSVGFRIPDGGLTCVVGIGAEAWPRLYPGATTPAGLHPFVALQGSRHAAPSTPGDLLFHIRAKRMDLCFELADRLTRLLGPAIAVVDEVHGFKYFDRRDLLGFVDGTENPTGRAAAAAVTIGDEDPDFSGGSYVIVQKYLHDMTAWNALSTEDQERVIGRTKLGDMELADDVKPPDSHVALNTVVDENGEEREILRDNMPFGRVGSAEYGTYFIGYAASPDIIELMLRNMFIGRPEGTTDRVLDFSTAVTGTLFFVPTADFLEDPPEPVPATVEQPEEPVTFSLRVGSLKGSQ
ncbi:Dyp-type peroxidase [Kutzneria sp. 744]|uniref:Dyp-type peroxidase n=1 Tax=Kutzneria sp. (strain 744) TaxID=345341 RepID=UPI0005BE8AC3|nr:Dyp-type peroxidase [Kutzneria sp. 744]